MGRRMRTTLPMATHQLQPHTPDPRAVEAKDYYSKVRNTRDYNRRHGVRELPDLKPGDHVRVRMNNESTWQKHGVVVGKHDLPRSYIVEADGGVYRRNRKHLAQVPDPLEQKAESDRTETTSPKVTEPSDETETLVRSSGRPVRTPMKYRDYVMS